MTNREIAIRTFSLLLLFALVSKLTIAFDLCHRSACRLDSLNDYLESSAVEANANEHVDAVRLDGAFALNDRGMILLAAVYVGSPRFPIVAYVRLGLGR